LNVTRDTTRSVHISEIRKRTVLDAVRVVVIAWE
jgi:hypothetical protein